MKYFVNWQCPLYYTPARAGKFFDIPINAFVELISEGDGFSHVRYNGKEGYVESRFIEEYHQVLPYNCVDLTGIQTATTDDFEQYVIWDGVKQVNMCGQMCVARMLGMPLAKVLENWKAKDLPLYKRIFGSGKARGTNADVLIQLLSTFGEKAESIQMAKYTPTALRDMVGFNHLICSVKMNATTGALRGGSVLHWILVREVVLERKGLGYVSVYNPAMNCEEVYSWAEWVAAAGVPYGIIKPV